MKRILVLVCGASLVGGVAMAVDMGGALKGVTDSEMGKAATSAVTDKTVEELTKKLNKVQNQKGLIKFIGATAEVDPACDTTMGALATIIKQATGFHVQVECHTDSAGKPADNLKLSQARADAVAKYLVEKKMVDAKQVSAKGWGDTKPDTSKKKNNNRVDFTATKS